jgi:D-glycero-alpha-D-manno-heptose 1-phosphate guanylyltransferase
MHVKTAVILAGGLGTRLRETVPDLPKPMAPIANRPFLEYQLDYWIDQGVDRFILSVGYLKNKIINHFGLKYKNSTIEYAIEDEPLGTGGALLLASKGLTEPFLVLNGDTFIEVNLDKLCKFHLKKKSDLTLSLFKTSQLERYMGIKIGLNDEILKLKVKITEENGFANGGVYLITPKILNSLTFKKWCRVSFEDEILPTILSNNDVLLYGMECKGKFIDIGIPADFYRAQEVLTH